MAAIYHYFDEIIYNTNLVFIILIFFGSLIMIYIITNELIKIRSKLKKYAQLTSIERSIARMQYKREFIIWMILFFEIMTRFICMINIGYLNHERKRDNLTQLQIAENCTIVPGTAVSRLYTRGYQYSILIGTFEACNLFVLSLLCYLSLFMIKVYQDEKKRRDMHAYLAYSITKSFAIPLLLPFPATYLISQMVYMLNLTLDYFLLVYLLRKLNKLIKRSCLNIQLHGDIEDISLKIKAKRNVSMFRQFSIILTISYGLQVIGQDIEGLIVSLLGSMLENPCWFHSIYGITYNVQFSRHAFELSGIIAVYVEFVLGTCFNIGLLASYLTYCFQVIKKRLKQVRVYRFHVERVSSVGESLLPHS